MFGITGTPNPSLSGSTMPTGCPSSIATLTSSVSVRPTLTSPRATRSRTTELPSTTRTAFAFRRRKKASILSSPAIAYSAATWNDVEPNRGSAIATCPRHLGSARSKTDCGASAGITRFVLYAMTRMRAEKPVQYPSA